jgi:tripartite-type tricarboxylate transporter receptor subunit TctC
MRAKRAVAADARAVAGLEGRDFMFRRRVFLSGLSAAGCLAAASASGSDAPYPSRPITLVAPFSPGGSADAAARLLATHAPRHLPNTKARIVVENRPGASGAIGTNLVARAVPDGYTLLLARVASSAILPAIDPRTPYAWDEFSLLGLLYETPFVVCVRTDAPWQRLGDLLGALREAPGRLTFATTGPATILDLGIRQLFMSSGLPIDAGSALPFSGGAEAVAAVVSGRAHFMGSSITDAIGALSARTVRALVVGSDDRLPLLPGVPTAKEAEVASLAAITGWSAVFGPAALPAPVAEAWVQAIASLGSDRAWVEAIRQTGSAPRSSSPGATRDFLRAQIALYADLARRLGLL